MIRRIVLLPDPDGPNSATSWPAGTSNVTPSTAWNRPNRFERFLTAMPTSKNLGLGGWAPPTSAGKTRWAAPTLYIRVLVRIDPLPELFHADQHDEGDAGQED